MEIKTFVIEIIVIVATSGRHVKTSSVRSRFDVAAGRVLSQIGAHVTLPLSRKRQTARDQLLANGAKIRKITVCDCVVDYACYRCEAVDEAWLAENNFLYVYHNLLQTSVSAAATMGLAAPVL